MKDIVIIGAGDFGREVAWLIEDLNKVEEQYNILGYVDDNEYLHTKLLNGYKVLGNSDYLVDLSKNKEIYGVISIQNSKVKKNLVDKLINIKWETLIHPSVIQSRFVEIGEGSVIAAGTIITTNVVIGSHCLLNLTCTVGHDCILEDYVSVMPGCNISGNVKLKDGSYLGTGVKIIPNKTVGVNSIIGAGAVVIKDVDDYVTVVGNPAKLIKKDNL